MRKFTFILLALSMVNIAYSQWTLQNSGTNIRLISVSAPSDSVVWVSGTNPWSSYNSIVLRTTNGGINWESTTNINTYPTAGMVIAGIDENTAVVCYDTTVYRTSNGGLNWNVVFTQRDGFLNAVEIQQNGYGIIQGDPVGGKWSLWETTDYGESWTQINTLLSMPGQFSSYNSLFVKDNQVAFCATGFKVFYSSNYGINWMDQYVPLIYWPIGVWFYNDTLGLAGGLTKTTNAGFNWIELSAPGSGEGGIKGITGYSNNWWYIRYYTIHYSSNYGASWSTDSITAGQELRDIALSHTGTSMWVVGDNGVIYSNNGITNIQPVSSTIPDNFTLAKNYPNPFNPVTKIKFDIALDGFTELTVYNTSGKLIKRLINEKLSKGSYETTFDGEGLSSGIYFYTLKSGNFIQTQKMVLVK